MCFISHVNLTVGLNLKNITGIITFGPYMAYIERVGWD